MCRNRRKMWTVIVMPMAVILPTLAFVLADEPVQRLREQRVVEKQVERIIQSMPPLTAEEIALHERFAALAPDVYMPRETVVAAVDRLGVSGIYSGEFLDEEGFPMFKAELAWIGETGELAVAIAAITDTNDCQPVPLVVDYSDARRIAWYSLDLQYSGWIVAYEDGFAFELSGPKMAYRGIVPAKMVGKRALMDSKVRFEPFDSTAASCVCRATPPKGTCAVPDCDVSNACTGGPGGQNCVWVTPCY